MNPETLSVEELTALLTVLGETTFGQIYDLGDELGDDYISGYLKLKNALKENMK